MNLRGGGCAECHVNVNEYLSFLTPYFFDGYSYPYQYPSREGDFNAMNLIKGVDVL